MAAPKQRMAPPKKRRRLETAPRGETQPADNAPAAGPSNEVRAARFSNDPGAVGISNDTIIQGPASYAPIAGPSSRPKRKRSKPTGVKKPGVKQNDGKAKGGRERKPWVRLFDNGSRIKPVKMADGRYGCPAPGCEHDAATKGCTTESNCNIHIKQHYGDPLPCEEDGCEKVFELLADRRTHWAAVHPDRKTRRLGRGMCVHNQERKAAGLSPIASTRHVAKTNRDGEEGLSSSSSSTSGYPYPSSSSSTAATSSVVPRTAIAAPRRERAQPLRTASRRYRHAASSAVSAQPTVHQISAPLQDPRLGPAYMPLTGSFDFEYPLDIVQNEHAHVPANGVAPYQPHTTGGPAPVTMPVYSANPVAPMPYAMPDISTSHMQSYNQLTRQRQPGPGAVPMIHSRSLQDPAQGSVHRPPFLEPAPPSTVPAQFQSGTLVHPRPVHRLPPRRRNTLQHHVQPQIHRTSSLPLLAPPTNQQALHMSHPHLSAHGPQYLRHPQSQPGQLSPVLEDEEATYVPRGELDSTPYVSWNPDHYAQGPGYAQGSTPSLTSDRSESVQSWPPAPFPGGMLPGPLMQQLQTQLQMQAPDGYMLPESNNILHEPYVAGNGMGYMAPGPGEDVLSQHFAANGYMDMFPQAPVSSDNLLLPESNGYYAPPGCQDTSSQEFIAANGLEGSQNEGWLNYQ